MKKKILIGVGVIILIFLLNFVHFVITYGSLSSETPSLGEKISVALEHPAWLSPFYTIVVSVSNPFVTLFLIILIVILYYLYDNFVKSKKNSRDYAIVRNANAVENQNQGLVYDENSIQINSGNRVFKKVVLWGTLVIVIWVAFVLLTITEPGSGMVAWLYLFPVMPIIYIFYPVYFIILSLRYSKEKSSMDPLDKLMFYILAVPIISLGIFAVYKVYSENAIQNLMVDHQKSVEKKMAEKQKGPADLVVKDFSFSLKGANIKFCNESTSATGKKVAVKVETDKGSSDIIENYPSLQPGECEVAQIVNENYLSSVLKLKKGESVRITITVDPKNKIIETNEENNKMTKNFNL